MRLVKEQLARIRVQQLPEERFSVFTTTELGLDSTEPTWIYALLTRISHSSQLGTITRLQTMATGMASVV
jgi:hypothetical protein